MANRMMRCRIRGIGLIEILVTIVLLSIGFLAAARMQVQGMRISQDAYNRSQAYFLAADMIDRMRSNVKGVRDDFYKNMKTSKTAPDKECDSMACSPQEAALQDLHEWSANLYAMNDQGSFTGALPGTEAIPAYGEITEVEAGIYQIEMHWVETVRGDDVEQTLSLNFATETVQ